MKNESPGTLYEHVKIMDCGTIAAEFWGDALYVYFQLNSSTRLKPSLVIHRSLLNVNATIINWSQIKRKAHS
jgi:hypothetical protein